MQNENAIAEASTFKDSLGRVWSLALTMQTVKEVAATKINLAQVGDGKIAALMTDDEKLCAVLWAIVKGQAEEAGVSEAEFGSGLDGNTLEAAYGALEVALVALSRPSRRPMIIEALARSREAVAKCYDAAAAELRSDATKNLVASRATTITAEKVGAALAELDGFVASIP